ncbi:methionyl-tRNA formyltransferase [Nocardia otitidiscaviarum]|uniref:Methionyl-tRNA formyltransferase n=2 Tax=Nocardia TaxID=1817 RepID=A0A516NMR3_9NOCA|nr:MULTISPECIES: methionyl-tRNA formyltransferase [Nocardia]MBF6135386.1 methionyl-tRNA formyltransferase [Nocardia otitidiscaviarum]MBF6180981.1 methionyl-tRNA formyltransferase [Nocardia otitidiscaviarum]MBF6487208.1 methionyl-tRNA formyltransferase [Nocardia otitidiscaviarum]MCP9624573.1 methionyl-tRNA formyltransferase [Nocardia otitidiscaviarum]QDP80188.1 methionyl-tRNA formyltransferase [Nocardia otitidiscaviarum]
MRVVFAGTPEPAVPSLRRLIASSRHEVVAVVTRPDAVAGRGRKVTRSPIGRLADEHGIPVLTPRKPSEPEFIERLRELAPDCCPVVAYGALLPQRVLDIPRHGWINLHFSLLPAWRGAAPVQAAILAGDEITGASTFQIEAGLDTGPVFGMVTEKIRVTDTAGVLLERLADSGAHLLETTLDGVEDGTVHAVPQSTDGISYAPKVEAEAGHIRWDQPALAISRRIRAVTPAPGAWTVVDGKRLKLGPVDMVEEALPERAIEVRKSGVYIGTATTAIRLDQVQPQGKKMMAALDWARGARLQPGAVVE